MTRKLIYDKMCAVERSLFSMRRCIMDHSSTRPSGLIFRDVRAGAREFSRHVGIDILPIHFQMSSSLLSPETQTFSNIGLRNITTLAQRAQEALAPLDEKVQQAEAMIESELPVLKKKEKRFKILERITMVPAVASLCGSVMGGAMATVPFIRAFNLHPDAMSKSLGDDPAYILGIKILVGSIPFVAFTGMVAGAVNHFFGVEIAALRGAAKDIKESVRELRRSLADLVETTSAYFSR